MRSDLSHPSRARDRWGPDLGERGVSRDEIPVPQSLGSDVSTG